MLIIEDEPMIAMDLEALVEELGHNVVFNARTQREAVAAIKHHTPGLVLADIRLADGSSGLDAVNDILGICEVPVIFITAYPEQLLTGERPEPTFLIVKPYRPETVKVVVSQALFSQSGCPHLPDQTPLAVLTAHTSRKKMGSDMVCRGPPAAPPNPHTRTGSRILAENGLPPAPAAGAGVPLCPSLSDSRCC